MQGAISSDPYTIGASAPKAHPAPLLSALYLLFLALALLRIALGAVILDLVINYSTDAGSVVEKLHPALYGFAGIALVALSCFRVVLDAWEVRVVRALLAFNAGIVVILAGTALAGRGGSTGFMIDTYCGASFAILLFLFPQAWRVRVGEALILLLALNALVAMVEFVLKVRFLPFEETETAFRPLGLSSHPLELGIWMAIGPLFTAATSWPRRTKLAIGGLLVAGLGMSGARTALVVGLTATVAWVLGAIGAGLPAQRRLERRLIAAVGLIALIPLGVLGLAAAGGLDRFATSVNDANAQTRIDVYGVFAHMTWEQILFGMDPAAMRAIAKTYFGLDAIESSVVVLVSLFGVAGAALFAALLAWLLRILLIGAKPCVVLAVGVFFAVSLSSNAVSTKGSAIFLLFTLIIAMRPTRCRVVRA